MFHIIRSIILKHFKKNYNVSNWKTLAGMVKEGYEMDRFF